MKSPVRSSRRSRSPPIRRRKSLSRSRSPSWRRGDDDDHEAHERRKLERKIREKEAAYQERLRAFETRERRLKRNYEKRDEMEKHERKEMVKEAKRLREFLADYDDDRSDSKYYIGNSLTKRLREREREIDSDERDRKKEKEEIEILRKRLVEENHSDPDAAIAKVIAESDQIWKPLIEPDTPPRKSPSPPPSVKAESSSSSSDEEGDSGSDESDEKSDTESSDSNDEEQVDKTSNKNKESEVQQMVASLQPVKEEPVVTQPPVSVKPEPGVVKMEFGSHSSPAQASCQSNVTPNSPQVVTTVKSEPVTETIQPTSLSSKRRKLKVSDVFNQDEEEDELPKKRKLVPLQYTDEERKAVNPAKAAEDERKLAEEKRKLVRALIERIPTQKDDLFDYSLDWSMVDQSLMEKRIQPWITKKIMEYIGEEEPTLVEFICSKIMTKSSPEKILEDISMVLDEEADVFVVKMWRLLIYETEAKKEGLTK
ncbi:unnamed protein product [Clavelina lepadiformis]|uniref:PWI domain-containing protein n=1 Tax=Clavelina lepadiformis TaxID=159417 RepID=A0ABP0H1L9_CLALP